MSASILCVLASGGIDSTSLIHYYLSENEHPVAIHFQYDQLNEASERIAVEAVCHHYNVDLRIIELGFGLGQKKYEYFARNALFILTAAATFGDPLRIALGIHSNTQYYDCSPIFIKNMQEVLDGYFSGSIQIETPFINYNKEDIVKYAIRQKVPLNLTYSCLKKNAPSCGTCPSCKERVKYLGY